MARQDVKHGDRRRRWEITESSGVTFLPLHVIPGEGPVSDAPQESLSLNFAKVNWKYSVLDAKTSEKPEVVGWDLTQQKKI